MDPTPPSAAGRSRWRRYLSFAATILLLLLWLLVAEPIIAFGLGLKTELETGLALRGALALLLALGFTIRGTWGANGFGGGLKLKWWRALWPMWLVAVPMLALYAGERSAKEHVMTLVFCVLIGFTEEAIFRGMFLRSLLPGGTRSAILWSAAWFAAFHMTGFLVGVDGRVVLLMAANAFAMGLIFAWVRIASASIWPALIVHGFYDYSGLIVSGGFDELMRYSAYEAVTTGLFTVFMLAWACWLIFRSPASGAAPAGTFDDLTAEAILR